MEASTAYAPRAVAESEASQREQLARAIERRISIGMILLHGFGAVDVFVLMFFVVPQPEGVDENAMLGMNLVAGVVYFTLASIVGMYLGRRAGAAKAAWVLEHRDPTPAERDAILRMPLQCLYMDGGLWLGGLVLFTALNATESVEAAKHLAVTILLGGLTVCAIAYLMVERIQRPFTAIALESGPPSKPVWPGVEGRLVLAWVTATGSSLVGIVLIGVHGLTEEGATVEDVSVAVMVLGVCAIALGLGSMIVAARTVSAPLTSLRHAQAKVEAGNLGVALRVADASEVGVLQSGFNRMVGGLREREEMRDLYSRQVGAEVARAALDGARPRLGGAESDVAVLFVDVVGSTRLAAHLSPSAVVERLNRFFAIVVEVVDANGGWVNKFEGDAALAIFGAPSPVDSHEACALAAGRALDARLKVAAIDAGIGVSAGRAVAGWVGAEHRFEYTVIGDPVNEAARLCELAKRRQERLLASAAILERAGGDEAGCWRIGEEAVLRGRSAPTRIALPA